MSQLPLILVVEDNQRNARLVTTILQANGYQVTVAGDGQSATAALRDTLPQLILMDLQLPDVDGLTLTRQFKSVPETAHIPIISLTAHVLEEHQTQAIEAGCCGFVSKPISYKAFLQTVADAIAIECGDVCGTVS
jgi:two-component system, cell cycle response regulator DivK